MLRHRLCTLILLSLSLSSSWAQSWLENYDDFNTAFLAQDYPETIRLGNDLVSAHKGKLDTSLANVYGIVAYAQFQTSQFSQALENGNKEYIIRGDIHDTASQSYSECLYYLSIYKSYDSDYAGAAVVLKKLNSLYASSLETSLDVRINVSWQLANMLASSNQISEAELYYAQLEDQAATLYSPEDSIRMMIGNAVSTFYMTNGMFDKAEPYFINAVDMTDKVYGTLSSSHVLSLNALGEFYVYVGAYDKAETVFTRTVKLSKKIYGEKSADHATAVNNLAVTYDQNNKTDQAIIMYQKVLDIKASVYKTESDYYALSLSNLAVAWHNAGNLIKAEKYAIEATTIYETINDPDAITNYGTALSIYASILSDLGRYDEAQNQQLRALEIQESVYGQNHIGYYNALSSYCQTLINIGKYVEAKTDLERCLEIQLDVVGNVHPDYAKSMLYLAQVNAVLNDLTEAKENISIALNILAQVYGKKSVEYGRALNTKANIEFQALDYTNCRISYEKALKTFKSIYGAKHLEYATLLSNFALFKTGIGEHEESMALLNEARSICQFNMENEPHASALGLIYANSNLSHAHMALDQFVDAEKVLIEAGKLALDILGTDHPDYASIIMNRAKIYAEIGSLNKAISYYDQAIASLTKVLGDKSLAIAGALNNKATVYLYEAQNARINYDKSIALANQAIDLLKQSIDISINNNLVRDLSAEYNNLAESYRVINATDSALLYFDKSIEQELDKGHDNISIAITYHNKAMSLLAAGRIDEAIEQAEKSIKIREGQFGKEHTVMRGSYMSLAQIYLAKKEPLKAKENLLLSMRLYKEEMNANFSFYTEKEKINWINANSVQNELMRRFAYDYGEQFPDYMTIFSSLELYMSAMLLRSNDKLKKSIENDDNQVLKELYVSWLDSKKVMTIKSQDPNTDAANLNQLNEAINLQEKKISELTGETISSNIGADNPILKHLKQNDLYIQFLDFSASKSTNIKSYFALIYSYNNPLPRIIKVCDEKDILSHIDAASATRKKGVDKLYGTKTKLNNTLGKLLMNNILIRYPSAKHLYYTPSGVLHKLSFNALAENDTSYYSARINFSLVNNPTDFFQKDFKRTELLSFELLGGIRYGDDSDAWSYLSGTKKEVDVIDSILTKNGLTHNLLSGIEANKNALLTSLNTISPDVLHIASHGFFYPDPDAYRAEIIEHDEDITFRGGRGMSNYSLNKNPMMRSGVVLANANNGNNEDGILSAYEVSLTDLSNIELVVLSACETGLGDISGSEGVFGLQRAFKMAGVKQLIMSLWQVPDKETSLFMTSFYTKLCSGLSIQEAFNEAQAIMKIDYDPYFWAAFILIE